MKSGHRKGGGAGTTAKKKKEKAVRNCTLLDNATHQRHHVARVSVFNTLIHNEEDSAKEKKINKQKKEQKATAYCKSNGLTPKKKKQTNKQTKKTDFGFHAEQ